MNPSGAKYFDGKSSKPHEVTVNHLTDRIHIVGSTDINRYWKIEDCTVESLNSGDSLLITYGDFPKESLRINRQTHASLTKAILSQQNNIAQSYQLLQRIHPVRLVIGSALLVVGTVFLYIQYISPWVGEQAVQLVPASAEIRLGKSVANNFVAMAEIDTVKTEQLRAFFEACEYSSDYPIEMTYLKGDVVNAFAAPGGQIVVYENMLQLTESPEELAGLLAHELAHVNQRHSMKNLTKSLSSYLILSVLTGDVGGISGVILENAKNLNEMANSRAFEKEADEVGLQYMIESRIDPNGMVSLFEQLQNHSAALADSIKTETKLDSLVNLPTDKYFEILSTHPSSEQRMNYLKENIQRAKYQIKENPRRDSLWLLLKEQ